MKYCWFQYQLKLHEVQKQYRYVFELNTVCLRVDSFATHGVDILTVENE